jgi:hypothetical protein
MTDLHENHEIYVEVAAEELGDLRALESAGSTARHVSALDGEAIAQIGFALTVVSLGVLRTWIRARVDRLKAVRIVWNGHEFRGLTAREVAQLLDRMEKALPASPELTSMSDGAESSEDKSESGPLQ